MGESRLINRNVTSATGRTSMRLEPELWSALEEMCLREGMTLTEAIRSVDSTAAQAPRTSAVRVRLVRYFREAATEAGHATAGHGTL